MDHRYIQVIVFVLTLVLSSQNAEASANHILNDPFLVPHGLAIEAGKVIKVTALKKGPTDFVTTEVKEGNTALGVGHFPNALSLTNYNWGSRSSGDTYFSYVQTTKIHDDGSSQLKAGHFELTSSGMVISFTKCEDRSDLSMRPSGCYTYNAVSCEKVDALRKNSAKLEKIDEAVKACRTSLKELDTIVYALSQGEATSKRSSDLSSLLSVKGLEGSAREQLANATRKSVPGTLLATIALVKESMDICEKFDGSWQKSSSTSAPKVPAGGKVTR